MRWRSRLWVLPVLVAVLLAASPCEVLAQDAAGAVADLVARADHPATGADGLDGCCICLCLSTASPVLPAMALSALASDLPAGPSLGPVTMDAAPDSPLRLVFHPPRLA